MSEIVLYHQDSCGQCKMAEILLKKNNIDFISCKDINTMKGLGIQHTPTLSVDGKLFTSLKEIDTWIKTRG